MASHRALFAAALLLAAASCAHGLSWPLCDGVCPAQALIHSVDCIYFDTSAPAPSAAGGQVWVTERPRTEPGVIGANLWFFCESGLNILGVSVSPCICNGTVCSPAVADAICQAFGFDEARHSLAPAATLHLAVLLELCALHQPAAPLLSICPSPACPLQAWSEEMGGEGPTITNATLQEPVRSLTGEVRRAGAGHRAGLQTGG